MFLVRVRIGKDSFYLGDGILKRVNYKLGEGENSSNCQFSIYDPTKKYTDKYFAYAYEQGGLKPLVQETSTTPGSAAQKNQTASPNISNRMKAFLDMIAYAEGANYNIRFGGATFNSFADHPNINFQGSTAAGRYQFLYSTWRGLNLPDFTPQNQDIGAMMLIKDRGANDEVESGNISSAIDILDTTWTSFQVKPKPELISFYEQRLRFYQSGDQARSESLDTIQNTKSVTSEIPKSSSEVGTQITIEVGFFGNILVGHSFICTGIQFSLFDAHTLEFTGQSAIWVTTQKIKNTAYQNITLKQFAEIVCNSYGLKLDCSVDTPKYEYFPQRGQTDYECLLVECRRLGYRVYNQGNTLKIYSVRNKALDQTEQFVIEYGDNLGTTFVVSHQAQTDQGTGARSSNPNSRTTSGQRKIELNSETGSIGIRLQDSLVGKGTGSTSVTGSDILPVTPVVNSGDKTIQARESVDRIEGLVLNLSCPLTPDLLLIDPDSTISTKNISSFLDRVWVCKTAEFSYDGESKLDLLLYSPIKARIQEPETTQVKPGDIPPLNQNGFIKPNNGVLTSGFRTRRRPNHQGVDLASGAGKPVWASADGTVSNVVNSCPGLIPKPSCGGGYGNRIYLEHADGYQTRYAHLSQVAVSVGETVRQGQIIGYEGNSGASRGTHLHWEIRKNGEPLNPANFVTL